MNKESIIEKIRKLRALSNNEAATLEEASTAAAIAEKLIQQHQLEEAELEIQFGDQEQVHEDGVVFTDWDQRQTRWQNILLTGLSRAYSCEGILKWSQDGRYGYYAIGRPSDIATMRYQYAYFVVEVTRLAHLLAPKDLKQGKGKHWYNSFYLGAVNAIRASLKKVNEEVKAQASSSALSIINKHADDALALRKRLHPNARTEVFKSNIDRDAWNLGHDAGSNLNPKPGLGSGIAGLLGK